MILTKFNYYIPRLAKLLVIILFHGCDSAPPAVGFEEGSSLECDKNVCLQLELGNNQNEIIILSTNLKEISGFQFKLQGLGIESFNGGRAIEEGFSVTSSPISYMVLGFSLMAEHIPAGDGPLLNIYYSEINADPICITETVFAGTGISTPSLTVNTGSCISF